MSHYHILSLDGGGIRGVLTATLLQRLEAAFPGFVSTFDLFAGTSTGGILALALASGLTPQQARDLYVRCGEKVFADTLVDDLRDLGNMIGAEYSTEPLKEILTEQFGDMTLAELPKRVLISSFDLDNDPADGLTIRSWKPKFFHNFPGEDSDGDQKVVDVAVRTSAAPTFFPIYQGYIDGGVIANNPAMCALAQALHKKTGGQKLKDVVMLSLGTGHNPRYLPEKNSDWGLAQWAPNLVSLILEGSVGTAEYQCKQILGKACMRINPLLPVPISLDRIDQIPVLENIAKEYSLSEVIPWVAKYFESLLEDQQTGASQDISTEPAGD
jgi:patatin-like phospholipase/acyl hydrolase